LLIRFLFGLVLAIGLAVRSAGATDNEKTWYVNLAMANDSGDGHSPQQAKKFLTSAASLSAEGDTFYIAPGVYAAANPKSGQYWVGSGWGTVLEKNAVFGGAVSLSGKSGVTIEDLKIVNTHSSGEGIYTTGCQACVLRRLWVTGPLTGGSLTGFDHGLIEQCQATSDFNAWVISGRCSTVKTTLGISSGTRTGMSSPMACFKTRFSSSTKRDEQITFLNCQAYSSRSTNNTQPVIGWEVDGAGMTLLQNCTALIRSTASNEASDMVGVSAKADAVCMLSGNCLIRTENAGTGNALDLQQVGNAVIQPDPSNTRYVTTSGTITVRLPNATPGASGGVTVEQ
jgi:hypothetical protein